MTMGFKDASSCWKEILSDVSKNRGLLSVIEKFARENTAPAKIVFGTSGWRGEIGTDFTFNNLRIVTAAIIEMLKSSDESVMQAIGVSGFEGVKSRGVIVGHDNRFLGPDFAMEVIGILQREGIKTWYAGEASTPEFSAGIEMSGAACAINLTPSHNPANYAGLKFNPSDGGAAGTLITTKIEEIADRMMRESNPPLPPFSKGGRGGGLVEKIDLTSLYIKYILERKTLDIEKIRSFIDNEDCIFCVDNVHGATRGRLQRILENSEGGLRISELEARGKIKFLRTEDDFLFGGVAPEPSEKNMQGVERVLRESNARFRMGVIIDPDGDRIRHADANMQIPMNYFGAMAFHFLSVHKGIKGIGVKSVGTSNLLNAIAEKLGIPVRETKVGFKNFRPYMLRSSKERAVVAFEESDGMTGYNHTLEKDALFGLLLAIEMMAVTGKNLSGYLKDIMDEFGHYYPDRSGIPVDRSLAGEPLVKKLSVIGEHYKVGAALNIGGNKRTISDVIIVDGTKLVFDDGSWLMIRPSGTEPKVRFYIEARTEEEKKAVFEAAEKITKEALGLI
ncbi:MAG: phosphomannomutase [Nitrospirae bacterium CG_4_10_14_3_um_filter_44_29]|nr:MAG: phosphomannomutase [Nitrospirae bacterium CG22_combo_CG10-13_8_21_14_all_44_11]PIV43338.1 MAG: phosphomannomutase [Nitrospirae bacterium CG02_land_8_20_14_3_00_44_33]PIX89554.1 MAG: phosphomannomutase [Nitrospirae bacterium CG_4_10_14_3_um_filter_44_29]